jgi:hypothetical protein
MQALFEIVATGARELSLSSSEDVYAGLMYMMDAHCID